MSLIDNEEDSTKNDLDLTNNQKKSMILSNQENRSTDKKNLSIEDRTKELITTLANNNQLIQNFSLQGKFFFFKLKNFTRSNLIFSFLKGSNAKGKLNLLKKTISNPNLNETGEHQLLGKSKFKNIEIKKN